MNNLGRWVLGVLAVVAVVLLIIFQPFSCGDDTLRKELSELKKKEQVRDSIAAAQALQDSILAKAKEDSLAKSRFIQEIVDSVKKDCCPDKKPKVNRQRTYIPPVVQEKKQEDYKSPYVQEQKTIQQQKKYPELPTVTNGVGDVKEFYDFCGLYGGDLGWHFPQLWMDAGWSDYSTGEVVPNPQRNGHNFRIKGEDLTDGFTKRQGRTKDGTYYIRADLVQSNSPCDGCDVFLRCSENSWTPQKMTLSNGYYHLKP